MAPIAGLLIEYFVVGCVAAIWALPLIVASVASNPVLPKDLIFVLAAALVPALYVVGMVCDLVGQKITHPFKEVIEAQVRKKHREPEISSQKIHAFAVAFEPALAKQIDERSVRDRIARGSLAAVLPLLIYWPYPGISREIGSLVALAVILALAVLWHRMQKLSASYEMQVLKALRAKYFEARAGLPAESLKE
jgi:hypothetical protein